MKRFVILLCFGVLILSGCAKPKDYTEELKAMSDRITEVEKKLDELSWQGASVVRKVETQSDILKAQTIRSQEVYVAIAQLCDVLKGSLSLQAIKDENKKAEQK